MRMTSMLTVVVTVGVVMALPSVSVAVSVPDSVYTCEPASERVESTPIVAPADAEAVYPTRILVPDVLSTVHILASPDVNATE